MFPTLGIVDSDSVLLGIPQTVLDCAAVKFLRYYILFCSRVFSIHQINQFIKTRRTVAIA